ncbi:MAG: class I SAM-dependent methyltransferase [Pseudomonadota bacterium]
MGDDDPTDDDPTLDGAYSLYGPEDNRRLYARWADSYDADLRDGLGYVFPEAIARLFAERAGGGPLLDVGCGTGLLAEALKAEGVAGPVDGVDLSPEMLAAARSKGLYRRLFEADLSAGTLAPPADGPYSGVVSVGAFTLGALGPSALDAILPAAAGGADFVVGVNAKHFEAEGFAARLDALSATGAIAKVAYVEGAIYAEDADHEHAGDRFVAACFEKSAG